MMAARMAVCLDWHAASLDLRHVGFNMLCTPHLFKSNLLEVDVF